MMDLLDKGFLVRDMYSDNKLFKELIRKTFWYENLRSIDENSVEREEITQPVLGKLVFQPYYNNHRLSEYKGFQWESLKKMYQNEITGDFGFEDIKQLLLDTFSEDDVNEIKIELLLIENKNTIIPSKGLVCFDERKNATEYFLEKYSSMVNHESKKLVDSEAALKLIYGAWRKLMTSHLYQDLNDDDKLRYKLGLEIETYLIILHFSQRERIDYFNLPIEIKLTDFLIGDSRIPVEMYINYEKELKEKVKTIK